MKVITSKEIKYGKSCVAPFFQDFVGEGDTFLDIWAGYCKFVIYIRCAKKYAVDSNDDTPALANPDVCVFTCSSKDLSPVADETVDAVFMDNFLEHLASKSDVLKTLHEIQRVLKPRGKVMILTPNIKYASKEYWDFFDHCLPLSHKSLTEALRLVGFEVELVIPRFLPYSTKSKIPPKAFLIKTYHCFLSKLLCVDPPGYSFHFDTSVFCILPQLWCPLKASYPTKTPVGLEIDR